jgi:hypothetical protein
LMRAVGHLSQRKSPDCHPARVHFVGL